MGEKSVVPFQIQPDGLDVDTVVKQAQQMVGVMRKMGIKEATFESGTYFSHDQSENKNTLAADGMLYVERPHTTALIMRNPGSSEQEAIAELEKMGVTQKAQGAFSSGKSQTWASLEHSKQKKEDV